MSQENVDALRPVYEEWGPGNFRPSSDAYGPDLKWGWSEEFADIHGVFRAGRGRIPPLRLSATRGSQSPGCCGSLTWIANRVPTHDCRGGSHPAPSPIQQAPRPAAGTRTRVHRVSSSKRFSAEEAKRIGEQIGIDWETVPFDVEQFRAGMDVELEHGTHDPATNVTDDNPTVTGKIALAHLNEFPDYYTRLQKMEAEAEP
jgi:hypothetical protein